MIHLGEHDRRVKSEKHAGRKNGCAALKVLSTHESEKGWCERLRFDAIHGTCQRIDPRSPSRQLSWLTASIAAWAGAMTAGTVADDPEIS